jgi:membrane-bound serine protease (ClpP class)
VTIIGTILAIMFLDPPWRYVVIAGLLAFDALQISIWLRHRKRRPITGADTLVGVPGIAITDLRPEGQVKLRGQIFKAECVAGVDAGDEVVVTGIDGLRLEVAPRA